MAESLSALVKRVNALTTRIAGAEGRVAALEVTPAPIPPVPVPVPPTPTPTPVPPAPIPGGNLTPAALMATVGPLIARPADQPEPFATFDANFELNERRLYDEAMASSEVTGGNHYGALRSRIQWAIRNGLPFRAFASDSGSVYERGQAIVVRYLDEYAAPNGYAIQPHNATGIPDAEILYLMEGKEEARRHIWWQAAAWGSFKDQWGQWDYTGSGDARILAISLQAMAAAHRLGIPFANAPDSQASFNNLGATSWREAGEKQIAALLTTSPHLKPDGTIHSLDHAGQCGASAVCEAFFMNAMFAGELLRWHGFVTPNQPAFAYARKIVDHLIAVGGVAGCLPYTSGGECAPDLAGYFVWPALVLWQETGDARYREFAVKQIEHARSAWVVKMKQFNQVFSTGAQSAEALLAGVPWR